MARIVKSLRLSTYDVICTRYWQITDKKISFKSWTIAQINYLVGKYLSLTTRIKNFDLHLQQNI
jgi:hypothetical protein